MSHTALVEELYRAFKTKDFESFRRLCAPDIEWIQNAGFPGGKTHRGVQAVVDDVFKAFSGEWSAWGFSIEEILSAERSVVVLGRYEGVHRATGRSFSSSAAHVYDIEDAKIRRFRQYTDTKVIWDAMG
ncbi:nuclear transport factor 2 family protein [Sorangium sp. So ce260]|uniref:nuclear transport factor 2 family protein n=1 Tax=Sorangium sp. So ce260 TaxID=3133291 RepID=UPI003F63D823